MTGVQAGNEFDGPESHRGGDKVCLGKDDGWAFMKYGALGECGM